MPAFDSSRHTEANHARSELGTKSTWSLERLDALAAEAHAEFVRFVDPPLPHPLLKPKPVSRVPAGPARGPTTGAADPQRGAGGAARAEDRAPLSDSAAAGRRGGRGGSAAAASAGAAPPTEDGASPSAAPRRPRHPSARAGAADPQRRPLEGPPAAPAGAAVPPARRRAQRAGAAAPPPPSADGVPVREARAGAARGRSGEPPSLGSRPSSKPGGAAQRAAGQAGDHVDEGFGLELGSESSTPEAPPKARRAARAGDSGAGGGGGGGGGGGSGAGLSAPNGRADAPRVRASDFPMQGVAAVADVLHRHGYQRQCQHGDPRRARSTVAHPSRHVLNWAQGFRCSPQAPGTWLQQQMCRCKTAPANAPERSCPLAARHAC